MLTKRDRRLLSRQGVRGVMRPSTGTDLPFPAVWLDTKRWAFSERAHIYYYTDYITRSHRVLTHERFSKSIHRANVRWDCGSRQWTMMGTRIEKTPCTRGQRLYALTGSYRYIIGNVCLSIYYYNTCSRFLVYSDVYVIYDIMRCFLPPPRTYTASSGKMPLQRCTRQ